MPTRVLTDRYIRSLRPPATDAVSHYDAKAPGLHLRLAASGARSWRFIYRAKGSPQQRVLTWPGVLSLAEARDLAKDAAGRVARGEDPAATTRAARHAAKDAASVEALVTRFLVEYVEKKGLKDAREIRRIFTVNV